jgi:hypothetical protein
MKEKILNGILNLFKVKSIVTFVAVGVFVYTVVTNQLEAATTTAIIMMVFQNLFNKDKTDNNTKGE